MAQQANFNIMDGAATPVARTFSPTAPGIWHARSGGIAAAFEQVEVITKPCNLADPKGVWQTTIVLSDPVLETQPANAVGAEGYTAAPRQAFVERSRHTFFHNPRSTPQQRKDLRVMSRNLLDEPQIIDLIENFVASAT